MKQTTRVRHASRGLSLQRLSLLLLGLLLFGLVPAQAQDTVRFAVIGDYGNAGPPERDVAGLVKSWKPDFIITVGDDNYPDGAASTIDQNIGQYYHEFISPYKGSWGAGATVNRFFPSLGNHDWHAKGAKPYLEYFTLPGNERYYDFVRGPVHMFAIDSDEHEPDGNHSTSRQALWLRSRLAASTARWKLVYFHHPPYSSGQHGSNRDMQWPFRQWGASAVLAGHDHDYERLLIQGFPYFVIGTGGANLRAFARVVEGSQKRIEGNYGAVLVTARTVSLSLQFYTRAGVLKDSYTMTRSMTPSGDGVRSPRPPGTRAPRLPVRTKSGAPAR